MKRILAFLLAVACCLSGFAQQPTPTYSTFGIDGITVRDGLIGANVWDKAGVKFVKDGAGKETIELDCTNGGAGINLPESGYSIVTVRIRAPLAAASEWQCVGFWVRDTRPVRGPPAPEGRTQMLEAGYEQRQDGDVNKTDRFQLYRFETHPPEREKIAAAKWFPIGTADLWELRITYSRDWLRVRVQCWRELDKTWKDHAYAQWPVYSEAGGRMAIGLFWTDNKPRPGTGLQKLIIEDINIHKL